jgi:epoxyqueuosine reductase QueG
MNKRMRLCLTYYAQPYPREPSIDGCGWGIGTVDRALELDYLHVGKHGAHELTDRARQELGPVVTVCDNCLMACCWQGEFMCDAARTAGTRDMSVIELQFLKRENEHYWTRR